MDTVTEIIEIKTGNDFAVSRACEYLNRGGIILFPTETVYGLGCDMNNIDAVKRIYELKSRDYGKPMAMYIDEPRKAEYAAMELPDDYFRLADAFLPGPLTIILKARDTVDSIINSGLKTIAIRIPDNKFMLDLLSRYGCPIVGTSANISGEEASADFNVALSPFMNKIDAAFYDNTSKIGLASTVISLVDEIPRLVRVGAISERQIDKVLFLIQ